METTFPEVSEAEARALMDGWVKKYPALATWDPFAALSQRIEAAARLEGVRVVQPGDGSYQVKGQDERARTKGLLRVVAMFLAEGKRVVFGPRLSSPQGGLTGLDPLRLLAQEVGLDLTHHNLTLGVDKMDDLSRVDVVVLDLPQAEEMRTGSEVQDLLRSWILSRWSPIIVFGR